MSGLFQLLEEFERVVVGEDECRVTGHIFCESFHIAANLFERVLDERVPGHLDNSLAAEVPADLLYLLCRDTIHVDKPDQCELFCVLFDISNLVLLP